VERLIRHITSYGLPERDRYDLPSSTYSFQDGGHYRIEIAGVERASSLEALVIESEKRKIPVHRVIGTVGGATHLDWVELREFASTAKNAGIEVIMTLGPRRAWDCGRQMATTEGLVSGMRLRGADNLRHFLNDVERCLEAGFRGFLVPDEGTLWVLQQLRRDGHIPKETVFKVSVFAGHGSPAGARLLESMGANSFNPLADLTLPMLASIRTAVKIPLDIYVMIVNEMGGFNRMYEAAEIARICSPCYLKFEPGESEEFIYQPWKDTKEHDRLVREKVRFASIAVELISQLNPELKASPWPKDAVGLAAPV